MPVSSRLSRKLYETFGEDAAHDMVDWMQQIDAQRTELRELFDVQFSRWSALLTEQIAGLRHELNDQVTSLRHEMTGLHHESNDQVTSLSQEMTSLRRDSNDQVTSLSQEMTSLRRDSNDQATSLRHEMTDLRHDMNLGLARLETKIEQRSADLIKWSFVFWVGAVGAIALLAGVLK